MRKGFAFVAAILIAGFSFAQSADSLKLLADAAVKAFTWDLQKSAKGTLMFLDVPYTREGQDSAEYLTLTVAKNKSAERPEWISVIIPGNIVQANGIFIAFANTIKTSDGLSKMELEKKSTKRIAFESCKGETCTARIPGGYLPDEKTGDPIDILQNFLDYDHVLFLFTYADGSHKSVAIPLFTFKQQYKAL
jgi:hypothetical protein